VSESQEWRRLQSAEKASRLFHCFIVTLLSVLQFTMYRHQQKKSKEAPVAASEPCIKSGARVKAFSSEYKYMLGMVFGLAPTMSQSSFPSMAAAVVSAVVKEARRQGPSAQRNLVERNISVFLGFAYVDGQRPSGRAPGRLPRRHASGSCGPSAMEFDGP
jgi:hypothetical protein